jgi:TIR domain
LPREFPIHPATIVETVSAILDAQNQHHLAEVLATAAATIEATDYDNWNGGQYYYTLHLELPVAQYAKIEPNLQETEQAIVTKLHNALRTSGNDLVTAVVITPVFEGGGPSAAGTVPEDDAVRFWEPGMFRLFLSHVSAHKVAVATLKRELRAYGVSGFVAHEDIEPTLEWQREIELALRSMDAMAALLTPDFHESNWTDQEVGVAFGRGIFVLPVRLPVNPYGFIAKTQGLPGDLAMPAQLASAMVGILLKRQRTAAHMHEGLVVALEQASSFAASKAVSITIASTDGFTPDQLARIESSIDTNGEVGDAFGVPARLRRYVEGQRGGTV